MHTDWLQPLTEIIGDEAKTGEVLCFIEEREREKNADRREKQIAGFRRALAAGVHVGRPMKILPENSQQIFEDFLARRITVEQGASYCGLAVSTFYRKCREYREGK